MDIILGPEVRNFVHTYIDDLLLVSPNFEEHLKHLKMLFQRLSEANLTININKTKFLQTHVKYLGFVLSKNGIETDSDKIVAIQNFPRPKNQKQLRAFLGVCNFYRKFVNKYSHETQPLLHLLRKGSRWNWTDTEELAFNKVKRLFLQTIILKFPNYQKTFYLETDSSYFALGTVLYQIDDQNEIAVVGFASRILRGAELFYTVTEKELLAIIFGLQKFRTIILHFSIVIRTDHHALKFLNQCQLLNDRLTR